MYKTMPTWLANCLYKNNDCANSQYEAHIFCSIEKLSSDFPVNMINLFIIGEWTNLSAFRTNWGCTSGWFLGIVSRK